MKRIHALLTFLLVAFVSGAWVIKDTANPVDIYTGSNTTPTISGATSGAVTLGPSSFVGTQTLNGDRASLSSTASQASFRISGASLKTSELGADATGGYVQTLTAGSDFRFYTANATLAGTITSSQIWRFGPKATADTGEIVFIENTEPTVTSSDIGLRIGFTADNDATGGQYIRFRDGDDTTTGRIEAANATTVSYVTSSDSRLKHDIIDLPDGLATVLTMQPRQFKWNADNKTDMGFIAQELKVVYPYPVSGIESTDGDAWKESPMGIDYGKLTPVLVKAIQELKVQHDALAADYAAYKIANDAALAALTARVAALELLP